MKYHDDVNKMTNFNLSVEIMDQHFALLMETI